MFFFQLFFGSKVVERVHVYLIGSGLGDAEIRIRPKFKQMEMGYKNVFLLVSVVKFSGRLVPRMHTGKRA